MKNQRLRTLLVEQRLIDKAAIDAAIARTRGAGCTWIEDLILTGALDEERLAACVARAAYVARCVPETLLKVPRDVLALVPPDIAFEHRAVPIGVDGEGDLRVVMLDPCDTTALDELTFFANRTVIREAGPATAIAWALHEHYRARSALWPRPARAIALVA